MATEMITLRVTPEQKAQLETLANQQGITISELLRSWIDRNEVTVEIPKEVADTVALCAELRGKSVADFVREYTARYMDCDSLADWCSWLIECKIRELLKENGAMTKDELAACLPSEVCDSDYHLGNLKVSYVDQRPDGKYELKKEQV